MNLRTRMLAALAVGAMIVGACQAGTPTGSAAAGGLDGALVKRSDIKIETSRTARPRTGSGASSATASRPVARTWA